LAVCVFDKKNIVKWINFTRPLNKLTYVWPTKSTQNVNLR